MNIPKILNVGYQNRRGTYTEKLAYVVYTDAKGVLRKETSWEGWCDKEIPKDTFDNVPTEGFVLNKGVGGGRGWDGRNEYIRVYDPRDFEFEISVANLLFILQECSSIKGKGLEGEFVYAWDRADLVLLPCCSKEHEECTEFTKNQATKVTKKDMTEGCTYQMRDMTNVMYMGRHPWFSKEYNWNHDNGKSSYLKPCGKKHIFLNLDSENKDPDYIVEAGFTRLAKKTSDEAISDYADAYETMVNSVHCLLPKTVVFEREIVKEKELDYYGRHLFVKEDDKYRSVYIIKSRRYYYHSSHNQQIVIAKSKHSFTPPQVKDGNVKIDTVSFNHYNDDPRNTYHDKDIELVTSMNKLDEKEFFKASMINEKGAKFDLMPK